MVEPILLSAVEISTFAQGQLLTRASGFFFKPDERLFLVTSRHVLIDEPTGHRPDRIEFAVHRDATDMTRTTNYSMLLYANGQANWRQGTDAGGEVDVAVIEIDLAAWPADATYRVFTPAHLQARLHEVEVGDALLIVGFPLGFRDNLHHLAVARHAVVASSFGVRFQGQGYFLTDARTHRGTSGAPVVMRARQPQAQLDPLPWKLLGVHSGRLDMNSRDLEHDESLGLNCAWYADILLTLTAPTSPTRRTAA